MPYTTTPVTIGTTPTAIALVPRINGTVPLTNTGSATAYLGGPDVAASGANQGFPVAAGATVDVPASASLDNELYGVVSSGSTTVNCLLPGSIE